MRPTADQVWEHVAEAVAARSLCERAQVGAVIVDNFGKIIATGYNGPPAGFDHQDKTCSTWCPRGKAGADHQQMVQKVAKSIDLPAEYLINTPELPVSKDYTDCPSLHAEANALMVSDRLLRQGGAIYVTTPPCYTCAKLIANSGLAEVYVSADFTDRSYRNIERSYRLLESSGLAVIAEEPRSSQ